MATRKPKCSLLIESHPREYDGYPFLTLIQYQDQTLLTIVDNMDDTAIKAYVLDYCGPENIDEVALLEIVDEWFKNGRDHHPISIEFAKHDVMTETAKIFRVLNINFVTRFIGPANKYTINQTQQIRRRKRKPAQKAQLERFMSDTPAD